VVGLRGPATSCIVNDLDCLTGPKNPSARKERKKLFRQLSNRKSAAEVVAPYIAELQRAHVPPSTIKQAKAAMLLLLGAR
jgi:hypothetical protein